MSAESRSLEGIVLDGWAARRREHALSNVGDNWRLMVDLLGRLQETAALAVPTDEVVRRINRDLTRAVEALAPYVGAAEDRVFGHLIGEPGRGQTFVPRLTPIERRPGEVVFDTEFGWFHAGTGDSAHGGAITLLFDEAMGLVSDPAHATPSRTAYLHVDFRSPTPVSTPLVLTARLNRTEGRKRYIEATLSHRDRVCAEAEALFVMLRTSP